MSYSTDNAFGNRKPVQRGPMMKEYGIYSVSDVPKFTGDSFDGRQLEVKGDMRREYEYLIGVFNKSGATMGSLQNIPIQYDNFVQVIADQCFLKGDFQNKPIVWSEHIKMAVNSRTSQALIATAPDEFIGTGRKLLVPIMPNYGIFSPIEFEDAGAETEAFVNVSSCTDSQVFGCVPWAHVTLGELRLMVIEYLIYSLKDTKYNPSRIEGVQVPEIADQFFSKFYEMNYQEARDMPTMDDQTQVPF